MGSQLPPEPLGDRQRLAQEDARPRPLGDAGLEGGQDRLLELRPEAAHVAPAVALGRLAQRVERVDAQPVVEAARALRAEAGEPREVDEPRRELRPHLLHRRDRPRREQRLELLLQGAPDARQLGHGPRARHLRHGAGGLAHGLGRVAVGEHAVHHGPVELVEVAELVEQGGDGGVRWIGHGAAPVHYAPLPGSPWLILPTLNEVENLEAVVARTRSVLAAAAPGGFRILVVEDESPDGTGALADRLAEAHDDVEVLHRRGRPGLGPAYLAGFARALAGGASEVFEMDAALSHDPADLGRLLAAVREGGADLALGSRYVPGGGVAGWGPLRRVISRGGSLYARVVLGLPVDDLTGGFMCFRREVLEAIDLSTVRSFGYASQVELTYRAVQGGFRVVEVPITFRNRVRGTSKMSPRIAWEAILLLPRLRQRGGRRARAARPPAAP